MIVTVYISRICDCILHFIDHILDNNDNCWRSSP
jgi:hypothetical protein